MPLYEYYCADCRDKFEMLMPYAASQADIVCAKCHGTQVRKLFSVFARSSRGGSDDFGDFGGDDGGDEGFGGGCACGGGGCSCGH